VKGFSINWGVTEPMLSASAVAGNGSQAAVTGPMLSASAAGKAASSAASVTQPQMSSSGVS
jgi:hypothetical protein